MNHLRLLPLAAGALAVALALPAQTPPPRNLDQIPVYAGAARTRPPEGDFPTGPDHRYFRTSAAIEEVVRFYQQRLAARPVPEDDDPFQTASDALKPGQMTPVFLKVVPWAFDAPFQPAELTARLKSAVSKHAPFRPGQWVSKAQLIWALKRPDGVTVQLAVDLGDELQPRDREFVSGGTSIHLSILELPPDEPEPEPD